MRRFEDEYWNSFNKIIGKVSNNLLKRFTEMETKLNIKFEGVFKSMKEKFSSIEFSIDKIERNNISFSQQSSINSKPATPFNLTAINFFSNNESSPSMPNKIKSKTPTNLQNQFYQNKTLTEPSLLPQSKDKT